MESSQNQQNWDKCCRALREISGNPKCDSIILDPERFYEVLDKFTSGACKAEVDALVRVAQEKRLQGLPRGHQIRRATVKAIAKKLFLACGKVHSKKFLENAISIFVGVQGAVIVGRPPKQKTPKAPSQSKPAPPSVLTEPPQLAATIPPPEPAHHSLPTEQQPESPSPRTNESAKRQLGAKFFDFILTLIDIAKLTKRQAWFLLAGLFVVIPFASSLPILAVVRVLAWKWPSNPPQPVTNQPIIIFNIPNPPGIQATPSLSQPIPATIPAPSATPPPTPQPQPIPTPMPLPLEIPINHIWVYMEYRRERQQIPWWRLRHSPFAQIAWCGRNDDPDELERFKHNQCHPQRASHSKPPRSTPQCSQNATPRRSQKKELLLVG